MSETVKTVTGETLALWQVLNKTWIKSLTITEVESIERELLKRGYKIAEELGT